MQFQKVSFKNSQGENLSARLDLPLVEPVAFALFAHCFTCTKNLRAVGNISEALNREDIAVLRFDFTNACRVVRRTAVFKIVAIH